MQTYFFFFFKEWGLWECALYPPSSPPAQPLLTPLTSLTWIWSWDEGSEILNLWKCCTNQWWSKDVAKVKKKGRSWLLCIFADNMWVISWHLRWTLNYAASQNKAKSYWKCKGISEHFVVLRSCWENGCFCIKELSLYPPCHYNLVLYFPLTRNISKLALLLKLMPNLK